MSEGGTGIKERGTPLPTLTPKLEQLKIVPHLAAANLASRVLTANIAESIFFTSSKNLPLLVLRLRLWRNLLLSKAKEKNLFGHKAKCLILNFFSYENQDQQVSGSTGQH